MENEYVGNGDAGATCAPHMHAPTVAFSSMNTKCLPKAPASPSSAEIPNS